jgi:hypothetical protein
MSFFFFFEGQHMSRNDTTTQEFVLMCAYQVYHSWIANEIPGPGRSMLIDEVLWSADGWPSIRNSSPSTTPQPIPGN